MKKLAMVLGVATLFAGTTSCKKVYTCTCDVLGTNISVDSEEKISKADAEAWCEEGSGGLCTLD
jgi:hypothetical protein